MDIEYLLLLQNFRETAGGVLTPLMNFATTLAGSSLLIAAVAFIYWAVDRQLGGFMMLNYVGSTLLNQVIKLTACVYRPWVRDARIQPVPSAIDGATGYSFPSGHTQNATAIYGSIGLWYRKKHRWVAVLAGLIILLAGFSRNYLGVHTPQDVVVGVLLCLVYIWLNGHIMAWVEAKPGRDAWLTLAGCALAVLAAAYFTLKSYPMDYQNGVLVVDPELMQEDGFKAAGMTLGFYPGWLLERRKINFSTNRCTPAQFILAIVALLPMLAIYKLLPALLAAAIGSLWAEFIGCAVLSFYVMACVPWVIRRLLQNKDTGV